MVSIDVGKGMDCLNKIPNNGKLNASQIQSNRQTERFGDANTYIKERQELKAVTSLFRKLVLQGSVQTQASTKKVVIKNQF